MCAIHTISPSLADLISCTRNFQKIQKQIFTTPNSQRERERERELKMDRRKRIEEKRRRLAELRRRKAEKAKQKR